MKYTFKLNNKKFKWWNIFLIGKFKGMLFKNFIESETYYILEDLIKNEGLCRHQK